MKIQLLSDLHLESNPDFVPQPAPGADVLVLAGDIGSYQSGSHLSARGDPDFGLARFSPRLGWPTPVLFVPGNHEYDGLDFDETHARLRETCARLGLTWLERETVVMPDRGAGPARAVRFVGTTLWSDFDALGPLAQAAKAMGNQPAGGPTHLPPGAARHDPPTAMTQQLRARDKAFRAANFYLRKTGGTRGGAPFLADAVREQALACQQWLRTALDAPFDGPTVVVTHFAPSLRSADPRYGLTPGTAGFCNALDDLLPKARLWLHGHLHAPSDYRHPEGPHGAGCRVVANPLGYARKGEQAAFQPRLIIDSDCCAF